MQWFGWKDDRTGDIKIAIVGNLFLLIWCDFATAVARDKDDRWNMDAIAYVDRYIPSIGVEECISAVVWLEG